MHHAIFRVLYPIFDKSFIFDSYSCRNGKGTHRAVNRLNCFANKVSANNTKTCWMLKCDVRKFFDSIDQEILINLIKNKIEDNDAICLLGKVIKSFEKGLPLGNITSQLFANIYLNELDQFIKHNLKIKYYIRYCDDFIILDSDRGYLQSLICKIDYFLKNNLKLCLHPNKVSIRKYRQGVDFLGYVNFPYRKILRPKTKHRIFRKISSKIDQLYTGEISKKSFYQTLQSYFGALRHYNSHKAKEAIISLIFKANKLE